MLSKDERLAKLEVREWRAQDFLTLELPLEASAREIAQLADALFQLVFACGDDYRVDIKVTRLS